MQSKEIEIRAPHGLHLRVAAQIVKETRNSQSKVIFYKDGKSADASSILELLILAATENSVLKITAMGGDEGKAIEKVSEILTDGAGI
ncbi:MAG: HPr family phosphocarrier protein [Candidatus Omnitrophica bacterium]|nr:HPr family phosphocarrier protein [Candidatus Omnitrophota bacterium]